MIGITAHEVLRGGDTFVALVEAAKAHKLVQSAGTQAAPFFRRK